MSIVYDLNEDAEVADALNSDNDDFNETIEENIVVSRRKNRKSEVLYGSILTTSKKMATDTQYANFALRSKNVIIIYVSVVF